MSTPTWRTYEEVAQFLIGEMRREFGLEQVQGKQSIAGQQSGTDWEIDAKGIRAGSEGFVIIECRRHTTSRMKQEALAGLAYRVIDAGAAGGILVSPLGLEEGAAKVAAAQNITSVQLDPNSTTTEYMLRFLTKVFVGLTGSVTPTGSVSTQVL